MGATWTMHGRRSILAAYLNPDVYVPPPELQVALTRVVPVANAGSAQLIEPTQGGYKRVDYLVDSDHWAPTGFGEFSNTMSVTFPEVTLSWGLICGWALVDAAAGQCVTVGSINSPFVAELGVVPLISPGVLLLGNYD